MLDQKSAMLGSPEEMCRGSFFPTLPKNWSIAVNINQGSIIEVLLPIRCTFSRVNDPFFILNAKIHFPCLLGQ